MSEEPQQPEGPFDPHKINTVDPQRLRFPLRYSRETFEPIEGFEVTEYERTPQGYLEIEWEYKQVQEALALDFDHFAAGHMDSIILNDQAHAKIDAVNKKREKLNVTRQAEGVDPLEPITRELNPRFFRHLMRPNWQDHLPTDRSNESEETWEKFKSKYPEHMQINLDELRVLDGKMRILSGDPELQKEIQQIHEDKIVVMRAASAFIGAEKKIDKLSRRISEIYRAAGMSNRSLTPAEEKHIGRLRDQQMLVDSKKGVYLTSREMVEEVTDEMRRRKNIENRRNFERGLVMTKQMEIIIDELLPALSLGKPALLVGDTGGAKTALAEYISREFFGKEPELISGYAQINSYQVMGKMNLKNEEGTSVSEFTPGPLIRAMEDGRPVILDEINGMPPEFLKRFNKIAQLRPGDTFKIQEDSGREITIQPGFFIIATANEKSKRYKGVEDLSVEFQNRFGPNVVRVHYPDNDVVHGEPPIENTIIAVAALTDRAGHLINSISYKELEKFIRACHVSQQVFTGNHGEGFKQYRSTDRIAMNKPGLDEAVLAPRTMVDILTKVRESHGTLTLEQALRGFIDGIKGDNDRIQMTAILEGHDLIPKQANSGGSQ